MTEGFLLGFGYVLLRGKMCFFCVRDAIDWFGVFWRFVGDFGDGGCRG